MDYAIIRLGNKQHRVRDGETLVVDRLPTAEGASFEPVVLLGGSKVTATVIAHERGPKIVIGKYRKRTGYKRRNGFRQPTSRVEISLGAAAPTGTRAARAGAETPAAKPTPRTAAAKPAPEKAPAPRKPAPKPAAEAAPSTGLPEGYEGLTVPQLSARARGWTEAELEAATAYERDHAARKGALAALEAALAKRREE